MKILLKIFSFLLVAGVMAGCSKNDDENGGGSNWKPNLGDYDPVPLSDFDNGFYKWCVSKFDATGDGILQYGEIKTVEKIYFDWGGRPEPRLESLNGIKYFSSLRYLGDYNGWMCENMATLDLSHNLMLDTLKFGNYGSKLRNLTLGNKQHLKYLYVNAPSLVSLDVAKCPNLKYLSISSHQLTSLDLSKCTLLEKLTCSFVSIISLDVSTCRNLKELDVFGSRDGSLKTLYVWKGWVKPDRWHYPESTQIIEK